MRNKCTCLINQYLLDGLSSSPNYSLDGAPFQERMQFLVKCSMSENVEALAFKVWCNYINNMFHSAEFNYYESGNNLFFFPVFLATSRIVVVLVAVVEYEGRR
jgi:hypothetical protein